MRRRNKKKTTNDVVLSLNGLEVPPLSHCITVFEIKSSCRTVDRFHLHMGWELKEFFVDLGLVLVSQGLFFVSTTHTTFDIKKSKKNIKIAITFRGRGFDPFDPRLLSIKLNVVLSLNGLEVSPLSHCITLVRHTKLIIMLSAYSRNFLTRNRLVSSHARGSYSSAAFRDTYIAL
ncbi:hypothetical protein SFRURICE_019720 [Spodoptera frugiperda]|nr:hypothetical protein SFRURICE_019720 [Spodoptera frugiperda]